MTSRSLGDMGEDAAVAAAVAAATGGTGGAGAGGAGVPPWLLVGPGDDAAVLDPRAAVAVSTDILVEGYDFRAEWSSGTDVGVKVAAQNLADVAAMGAAPLALLVALAAPATTASSWVEDLSAGLALECRRAGARVVGGDVSEAPLIVVTGTAIGVLADRAGGPVPRSGGRAGDVVAVAGVLGRSAAGLSALIVLGPGAAEDPMLGPLVRDHRRPRADYAAGPAAALAGATAMIDVSDGLARDAARIAGASGVDIDLDGAALAPDADLEAAAGRLQDAGASEVAASGWVVGGGEDHALLACFPTDAVLPEAFWTVGRVVPTTQAGPRVLVDGVPWRGTPGFRHFAGGPA